MSLHSEATIFVKMVSANPGLRDMFSNIKSAVTVYLHFYKALDLVPPDLLF